ncbi:hypothetical protein GCM10007049_33930 [Echinicola pacifica]|uniref:Uncharacterized protein n=1 Tax=Echinicola pacifica TaxID=346377 RepID=A0A918QAA9_9BACT|nr:hypothetical protein [Echinicola pacifica]GGZ37889.1 hypothetical protein GCM10007049_33930 [Echinicola pacifica]
MKKVLILSYYFTPCTLTPSQRITYWGKNLSRLGYFPTIITREWNEDVKSHFDTKRPLGKQVRYEKHEEFEVYYLPFHPGILDKSYLKWGESSLRILFYLIKFLDVILVNFTLKFTSFKGFLPFISKLVKANKFQFLLISGEPFYLFKIGYIIKKKMGLRWIADYRDDWTTNELQRIKSNGIIREILFRIESMYEKKWVSTSDAIISVSDLYTDRLSNFLGIKGVTIENGFEESLLEIPYQSKFDVFTVVYSGTLYPSQDVSIILGALKKSIKIGRPFNLVFLGAGFDIKVTNRINEKVDSELERFVKITDRIPRSEALIYLQKAHVVLGVAYQDLKGIPSSKLYEYIGLKKPVLLCPSDQDIMEQILNEVGLGFFANDIDSCLIEIDKIRSLYSSGEISQLEIDCLPKIRKYSRFNQMSRIGDLLDK